MDAQVHRYRIIMVLNHSMLWQYLKEQSKRLIDICRGAQFLMVSFSCRHHFDWRYWTSSLEMVLILSCCHPSLNSLYILKWWRGNPRICSMMGRQRSGGAPHNGHFWAKDLNYPFSWQRRLSHSWGGKFNLSPRLRCHYHAKTHCY